jgi:hypothetical protein
MKQPNIVCVLRSGGAYTPEYVHRLQQGLRSYLRIPHRVVILTDMDPTLFGHVQDSVQSCTVMPLMYNWPGWWSKLEVFRLVDRPTLYFDLDTIIKGDITDIVEWLITTESPTFFGLEDWLEPTKTINSSVMYWLGNFHFLTGEFAVDPERYMQQYRKWPLVGDQGYITERVVPNGLFRAIQPYFPGRFVSYKKSELVDREKASVICFHGSPKPHERKWNWK